MIIMFTGHRNSKREARLDLIGLGNLLKKLISKHKDLHFIAGGCPGFDTMAMDVLKDLEVSSDNCTLFLPSVCPVIDSKDLLGSKAAELVYDRITNRKYFSPNGGDFTSRCMKRNKAMVLESDICITNLTEKSGGTFQTIKMAKAKGSMIYYIKGDRYESHPIE